MLSKTKYIGRSSVKGPVKCEVCQWEGMNKQVLYILMNSQCPKRAGGASTEGFPNLYHIHDRSFTVQPNYNKLQGIVKNGSSLWSFISKKKLHFKGQTLKKCQINENSRWIRCIELFVRGNGKRFEQRFVAKRLDGDGSDSSVFKPTTRTETHITGLAKQKREKLLPKVNSARPLRANKLRINILTRSNIHICNPRVFIDITF